MSARGLPPSDPPSHLPTDLPSDPAGDPTARAALTDWRRRYVDGLAAPDGWWSVSGLVWLDGEALVGSAPEAQVRLSDVTNGVTSDVTNDLTASGLVAKLTPTSDGLRLEALDGARLLVNGTPIGAAATLPVGRSRLTFAAGGPHIVDAVFRNGRWAVRSYDARLGAARPREDVAWFEPTAGWRVRAKAQPLRAGETVTITDVLGETREMPVAARLRFALGGEEHELVATAGVDGLFVNFRDATNGASDPQARTYGAGRFLQARLPTDGVTMLDFHRAHHPPCAHTPYAMCPLAPATNRLGVAVLAGERLPTDARSASGPAHHGP